MRKKRKIPYLENPTAQPFFGQPDDCLSLINKYGTYEIQPTADTENVFPAIAQGLPQALQSAEIRKDDLRDENERTH